MLTLLYLAVVLGVLTELPQRNPSAAEDAMVFHGFPVVHRLSKSERKMPKEAAVVGSVEAIEYRPPKGSKRQGRYRHNFGEGGIFAQDSKERPLLVEKNGRLALVKAKSPATFSPLVGILR